MKLIIDIPEDMFKWFKDGEIIDEYDKSALKQVFKNGTPLDDIRAEIVKAYEDATMYSCDEELSRFASRVCGIINPIGKESEVDFPQAKDIEPTVKGFVNTMNILDRLCKESEE